MIRPAMLREAVARRPRLGGRPARLSRTAPHVQLSARQPDSRLGPVARDPRLGLEIARGHVHRGQDPPRRCSRLDSPGQRRQCAQVDCLVGATRRKRLDHCAIHDERHLQVRGVDNAQANCALAGHAANERPGDQSCSCQFADLHTRLTALAAGGFRVPPPAPSRSLSAGGCGCCRGQGVRSTGTGRPSCTSSTARSPRGAASSTTAVRRAPTAEHATGSPFECSMTMTTTAVDDSTASAV